MFVVWAAVTTAGFTAAVWGGSPLLAGTWDPIWLAAGTAVGAAGAVAARDLWRGDTLAPGPSTRWAIVVCALFAVLATVGAAVTPVIDGRPIPMTSLQAELVGYVDHVEGRIGELAAFDELMNLEQTQARLRAADLEAAYNRILEWATTGRRDVSDELAAVEASLDQATTAAVEAFRSRLEWVESSDPIARTRSDQYRTTYITAILDAVSELQAVGAAHDVPVGPSELDIVE